MVKINLKKNKIFKHKTEKRLKFLFKKNLLHKKGQVNLS